MQLAINAQSLQKTSNMVKCTVNNLRVLLTSNGWIEGQTPNQQWRMALCERQRACVAKRMQSTLSSSQFTRLVPCWTSIAHSWATPGDPSGISVTVAACRCVSSRPYLYRTATGPARLFTFCKTRLTGDSRHVHRPFSWGQSKKMLTEKFNLTARKSMKLPPLGIVLVNALQSNAAFFWSVPHEFPTTLIEATVDKPWCRDNENLSWRVCLFASAAGPAQTLWLMSLCGFLFAFIIPATGIH